MKRRVFHLITTLDAGDVEKHLLTLAGHVDRERWEVSVGYLKGRGEWAGRFRDLGVAVTGFRMRRALTAMAHRRLKRHLAELRPDVVHTHLPQAHLYGGLAARASGVPVTVATVHEESCLGRRGQARRTLAASDAVVALSHGAAARLERSGAAPAGKIRHIPFGIDADVMEPGGRRGELRRGLGLPDTVRLVVSLERPGRQGGRAMLLDAAERLSHQFPEVMFLLVGRGDPADRKLERLIARRRLSHSVLVSGLSGEAAALCEADLFVLPSTCESTGMLLLEAMARALPVIAAAGPVADDIILNEATGILLERFTAETLAASLARLLSAPELGRMMGQAARTRAREDFPARRMAQRTEKLYDELLGLKT